MIDHSVVRRLVVGGRAPSRWSAQHRIFFFLVVEIFVLVLDIAWKLGARADRHSCHSNRALNFIINYNTLATVGLLALQVPCRPI